MVGRVTPENKRLWAEYNQRMGTCKLESLGGGLLQQNQKRLSVSNSVRSRWARGLADPRPDVSGNAHTVDPGRLKTFQRKYEQVMNGKPRRAGKGEGQGADSHESTFRLSNHPNLGKQLKSLGENGISSKPNLEELFALSQHSHSRPGPSRESEERGAAPAEAEPENNEIASSFDQILSRALNPYSSQAGRSRC